MKYFYGMGVVLVSFAFPAYSLNYYLESDLGTSGLYHLCRYSNGRVYSFNATDLCPLQVSDNGANSPSGAPPQKMGFKVGEYQDGMTKICVYDVFGQKASVRIGASELCPINHNF